MGILKFIEKVCVQDAIYWGNPTPNGFGNMEFDTPRQVKVRWDEKMQMVLDDLGREIHSKSQIMCPEELDIGGFLMLGELSEIELGDGYKSPQEVNVTGMEALEIKARTVTPLFRSTDQFVYNYFLSPQLR